MNEFLTTITFWLIASVGLIALLVIANILGWLTEPKDVRNQDVINFMDAWCRRVEDAYEMWAEYHREGHAQWPVYRDGWIASAPRGQEGWPRWVHVTIARVMWTHDNARAQANLLERNLFWLVWDKGVDLGIIPQVQYATAKGKGTYL